MKKQLLIGMFTATLQVGTLAATQEECQAEVLKVVQMPAIKKMLEAQRNDVESVGNDLCYFRSKYEAHKDRVLELSDLLEQLIKLNASFCGPNPDSIGRGATCRKAKDEEETKASELALKVSELKKGDKKIRKLVAQYEKLRTSKPLQTNAPELSVAGRRTAAIAKVKGNILESLRMV